LGEAQQPFTALLDDANAGAHVVKQLI